ncbi:MAG: hypothetical protein Q9160_003740 [Pyrenula sp. 1 TL-2023]
MGFASPSPMQRRKAFLGVIVVLFFVFELNTLYPGGSFLKLRGRLPAISRYHESQDSTSTLTHEETETNLTEKLPPGEETFSQSTKPDQINLSPGNSTLGFSRIISISAKANGRRTEDLLHAAKRTGLDIEIAVAPNWPDEEVDELRKNKQEHEFPLARGGARAWLSHAHTVREFIKSGAPSALIIEGDVDWDLDIKKQMMLISENIQHYYRLQRIRDNLKRSTTGSFPTGHTVQDIDEPYALSEYDILWTGLLGWSFYASYSVPHTDVLVPYIDDTIIDPSLIHPMNWPLPGPAKEPKTRTIFFPDSNPAPCSTFAYSITQKSAPKLLALLTDPEVTDNAHDVTMRDACRDRKLDCVAVWPEIMHHQKLLGVPGAGSAIIMADEEGKKLKAAEAAKAEEEKKKAEEQQQQQATAGADVPVAEGIQRADLSKREDSAPEPVKVTANIRYSARCNSEPGWEERLQEGQPPITCLPEWNEKWEMIGLAK